MNKSVFFIVGVPFAADWQRSAGIELNGEVRTAEALVTNSEGYGKAATAVICDFNLDSDKVLLRLKEEFGEVYAAYPTEAIQVAGVEASRFMTSHSVERDFELGDLVQKAYLTGEKNGLNLQYGAYLYAGELFVLALNPLKEDGGLFRWQKYMKIAAEKAGVTSVSFFCGFRK